VKLQLQETGALIPDMQEAKCAHCHRSAQASFHESFQDDLEQRHSPGRVTKMAACNGNFEVKKNRNCLLNFLLLVSVIQKLLSADTQILSFKPLILLPRRQHHSPPPLPQRPWFKVLKC
jgi:hypothetical protein